MKESEKIATKKLSNSSGNITCFKSTIKTLEKGVKNVQS